MELFKNADVFRGFSLDTPFRSAIPDGEFFAAGAIDSFYANLARGDGNLLVYRQAENFTSIARYAFGWSAVRQGILESQYDALAAVFDSDVTLSDVNTALQTAGQIVGGLASLGTAIEGMGSAVPIAGIVINLAAGVVRWVQKIVDSVKKDPPSGHPARVYDRDNDTEVTRAILDAGRGEDWTSIFLPAREGVWHADPAVFSPTGRPDGVFIEQGGRTASNLGWGIPPLLTEQLGPYQYPKILPGSKRPAGHESLVGYTELHPSAVQAGLLYSQRIFKMSASMFAIDPARIVQTWRDYFGEGRALRDSTSDAQLRSQLDYALSWANIENGWRRYGKYGQGSVPSRYQKYDTGGWLRMDELIRYLVFEVWWGRAMATLGTTLVAYVPPNSPALRSSGLLASRHTEMRKLLLKHPRRWDVELEAIPDAAYRSAMVAATMKVGEAKGFQQRTEPKDKPKVSPVLAQVDPDALPLPPDADAEPAIPTELVPEEGSGMGLALAGGVLGVAAVLGIAAALR